MSCECTTARVGGARPSTIDAWQCFLVGYTWLYKEVTFVFLLSFPLSLPFDWTLRCWVCVCCTVLLYFRCYVMCKKKKIVDYKKINHIEMIRNFVKCELLSFVSNFGIHWKVKSRAAQAFPNARHQKLWRIFFSFFFLSLYLGRPV